VRRPGGLAGAVDGHAQARVGQVWEQARFEVPVLARRDGRKDGREEIVRELDVSNLWFFSNVHCRRVARRVRPRSPSCAISSSLTREPLVDDQQLRDLVVEPYFSGIARSKTVPMDPLGEIRVQRGSGYFAGLFL
jgi:hypothetical protein